ncbi:fructose 2,6-bisphosphatase [Levilactobacillus zymae]|uniref:Fructose 2,6-bisphosphatase n=1 Tax=Levilactobacillus zymae TaxID=267363 RepID=A0ABQ0WXT8_9LACO|nr:histidine phosphatase family protein [Levilactobacillus zymae]KRL11290.1 phosphoglycerate mutase [Levilactobacillus zymae DSM 19395]QFR60180.1 histidine phosphatase family protein [Levilactobacillus zymae]GEO71377.1 fructose 2,6-bisphosphatase [Levilactobacillus zymae]
MATVELYLVRHGQTYLNKYFRIQGWSDSPLTDKGIADADNAGARLAKIPFAAAYASDTNRAQTTAKHILAANQTLTPAALQTEVGFREENFGYYEGLDSGFTWHAVGSPVGLNSFNAMIRELTIEKTKDMFKAQDPYHDAENNEEFWARVQPALDRVMAAASDGDKVLIASHSTTIRSIVSKFNKKIDISVPVENGSITKLTVTDGRYRVDYYNNTTGKLN